MERVQGIMERRVGVEVEKKNYLLLSGPPCVLTGRSGCHHAAHKLPAPMARSVVAAGGRGAS
jgi:hypothetical protein